MPTTGTMKYLTIGDATYEVYNTDTEVVQTYAAASGYTNWRPLVVGYSSNSSETTAPTTTTGTTYTFNTIKVKPSDGTIRFGAAALYNGDYTSTISADTLTASRTLTAPNKSGTIALVSDIPDVSGYAPLASPVFTGTPIAPTPGQSAGDTEIATVKYVQDAVSGAGAGTVTSVAVANDTNGGLSVSGSPITSSGTITLGHSNVLSSAQTTQAVYPIKIDKNGHISEYGSAVTIPTKVSQLTNDSGYITSYTETDPVFSASAAAGITSTDINNWNAKVSDDKTWNGVGLGAGLIQTANDLYVPANSDDTVGSGTMYHLTMTHTPTSQAGVKYDADAYLYSTTPSASDNSTKVATTAYVDSAITALPEPMIFKGSLGTGGTITSLPAASSSNEGFTYKVITAGTYASQSAKIGDTFISDGNNWILIPSGDEPSGTVTSVGVSNATDGGLSISGSPITSSGSITVGHSNVLTSAQTTSGIYPIKIDKNGHISEYGSAVSITDEKVAISTTTNNTSYYPILGTETTASTRQYDKSFKYFTAAGYSLITIGDPNLDGSSTSKIGGIQLIGTNHGSTTLYTSVAEDVEYGIYFPAKGGTVALTSDIPTVPTITLNGSSTTTPSFYAPTTAGTSGQVLTSSGSGAPTWSAITVPTKTSDLTNDSGFITGMTILSYGSSTWQNFIDAYDANKVVYCRASSNSNPASGSQTRLAFMAYVNNATTPTEVEFQYYRSVSTHTESQQGDQVYVYKLNKTNGWSVTVREASVKVVAGTGLGGTYSNGTMTLTGPTISLNGSSTTSASFYAPTTAGTSGYYLKSNGSGAPSWTSFPTIVNTRGTPTSGGTTLSVVNTGDMYTWNNKSQVQIVTWSEE